jgi:hypothetical protein
MPKIGWIHPVFSELKGNRLITFINKRKDIILEHFAILNDTLDLKDGRNFGQKNQKMLLLMYNSFDKIFLYDMQNELGIDVNSVIMLDDLRGEDKEYLERDIEKEGAVIWRIKNIDYLDRDYYHFNPKWIFSDFFYGNEMIFDDLKD